MRPELADYCYRKGVSCFYPEFMEPQIDPNASESMFKALRQAQGRGKLQNLTLLAGDYGRQEGGGLRYQDMHVHEPTICKCRITDDGSGICEVPQELDPFEDYPEDQDDAGEL